MRKDIPRRVADQVNLIMEATEVAKQVIPCIFDSNQAKILTALYIISANRSDISYRRLAEYCGIGVGGSIEYPLKALEDLALIYRQRNGKSQFIGITEMGKIAAEGVINTLEFILSGISNKNLRPDLMVQLYKFQEVRNAIHEVKAKMQKAVVENQGTTRIEEVMQR